MWYTNGNGNINIQLTKAQAASGAHPGPCDADIAALRELPSIRRQLAKIDAKLLADELAEYGAWDAEQLANHDENLTRILWIACGDITDNINS